MNRFQRWSHVQTRVDRFFWQKVSLAIAIGIMLGLLVDIAVKVGV